MISFSAPSQPTGLTTTGGKNVIYLTWYAPKFANGIIRHYRVKYRSITTGCEKEYIEKYTNDEFIELAELYSNIDYEIEVSAKTVMYGKATVIRQWTIADRKWDILTDKFYFFYGTHVALNIPLWKMPEMFVIIFWSFTLFCQVCFTSVKWDLNYRITNHVHELLHSLSNNLSSGICEITRYWENLTFLHQTLIKLFASYYFKRLVSSKHSLISSFHTIFHLKYLLLIIWYQRQVVRLQIICSFTII